jgi:hypothetical protein
VKEYAAVVSNKTEVAPVKSVPVIVIVLREPVGPAAGETLVTLGAPKLNWSAAEVADVPPGPVTVMCTVPEACAGLVAVIWLSLSIVYVVAAVVPNITLVAPVK